MICDGSYYYDPTQRKNRDIAPEGYPVFVLSCGYSTLISQKVCCTIHPIRMDYQLIYVNKGCLHQIDENNQENIVPEGSFIIFNPGDVQNYTMYLEDNPEIYWCHFSGKSVSELLKKYNLNDKKILFSEHDRTFSVLFNLLRKTLKQKPLHYIDLCALYFQELIIHISSNIYKEDETTVFPESYKEAVNYLESHYFEKITLSDLSKIGCTNYKTLTNYFLKFRQMTPMKFLTDIRLEHSAELLVQTVLQIKEIANAVGYNDPLYFTKSFSKKYGMSPKEYREKNSK